MIELLLIKPVGYLVLIGLPAWLILQIVPEPISRVLKTKLWDDPDQ